MVQLWAVRENISRDDLIQKIKAEPTLSSSNLKFSPTFIELLKQNYQAEWIPSYELISNVEKFKT